MVDVIGSLHVEWFRQKTRLTCPIQGAAMRYTVEKARLMRLSPEEVTPRDDNTKPAVIIVV